MRGWSSSALEDGVRFHFDLEDMGRLGLLVLARGRWNGIEVIPRTLIFGGSKTLFPQYHSNRSADVVDNLLQFFNANRIERACRRAYGRVFNDALRFQIVLHR